jgi:hypothetical protein
MLIGQGDFHVIPMEIKAPVGNRNTIINVIKRTYSILPDGTIQSLPLGDQPEFMGVTPYEDELGRSIIYPGDLAHFKPLVDFIVNGTAFAPEQKPVETLDVSFEISGSKKSLRVYGNRRWTRNLDGQPENTRPEPFTMMPIRWEKSYGGLRNAWNRNGLGEDQDHETDPEEPIFSLPNIENPNELIRDFDQAVRPVGFSAIPETWEPRFTWFGTRSAYWANFRAPLPPKDRDERYENAAPEDQQYKDLLGNETVTFENMNENFPTFNITLPNYKPRLFYVPSKQDHQDKPILDLIEIDVRLDTIVVDLNEGLLTLLWRGPLDATDTSVIEKFRYLYCAEDEPYHKLPIEEIQTNFNKEIEIIEPAIQKTEVTADEILTGVLGPAIEQIVKSLKEAGANPALIASVTQITDPQSGISMLKAEFEKVTDKVIADCERNTAKFNAMEKV